MDATRMLGPGEGFELEGQDHEPEHARNPLLVMHLLLQGRYWLAILLALVCAGAGVYLGYTIPPVTYSSTGTIHIRPVISPLLFDKSGTMPMWDSFVGTQIGLLKSERCLDMATSSPRWLNGANGVKRSNSEAAEAAFKQSLVVTRDGEFVRVTFTDVDPGTALDGVATVIDAYQGLTRDLDPENTTKRQQQLDQIKTDYEKTLRDARTQISEIAGTMTPEALQIRYTHKLTEMNEAETQEMMSKAALENWLAAYPGGFPGTAPAPTSMPAGSAAATAPAKQYTAEEVAKWDPIVRQMLEQRAQVQADLDLLLTQVGPNHPLAQNKKNLLGILDKQIEERVAGAKPPTTMDTPMTVAAGMSPAQAAQNLANKEELDRKRLKALQDEVADLGKKVKSINELQSSVQQTAAWLEETKQKLEELRVTSGESGHILILSNGERPVRNDRRLLFAAGSGLGGVVLGFALVLLLGLTDRRLRTIDQARMSLKQGMRVLGMLPSLPKNLEDPASAAFAALCVHHIRMLLQVMPRLDGHPAIAITSPSPGDGKTSLTLALALSYAASGRSTLLIDCDMVGAGLTRRVNAIIRRRIGQILIRENLITPAELREALSAAQRSGRKLGEVLVDEGYVDAEQLAQALKQQGETSVGLLDVMRGEALEECVADTGTARLWILPVGSALAEAGATISPEGFRAVLDQARARFEVVLVDTGPIPGSIESSVAASQVDGVVLTVSRGEQGPLVKRASEHLRDIGARALGIVFNRATPNDFSSSYGSMSSPSIPDRIREKNGTGMPQIGPVAAAVAGRQKTLKGE